MPVRSFSLAAVCAIVFAALPAGAHHSHGNYAMAEFVSLEGRLTEIHLFNPHSWVYLEVRSDKGEAEVWALEATSLQGLARNGITKDYLKVGDPVKVRCHRLKDGTNGCLLGYLTPTHGDAARGTGVEKSWD